MILYKKKFRYVCVYIKKNSSDIDSSNIVLSNFTRALYKRLIGLNGSVDFYKSNIRIINVANIPSGFVIIKCRLEYIDNVLLSLYFVNYPLMILPISGTIKQLKKRIQEFLIDKDFLIES
jgi:RNase P/RNase MRP subunit POP5